MTVDNKDTSTISYTDTVDNALAERRAIITTALDELRGQAALLGKIAALVVVALRDGHKVLLAGNGGSAAEAQHFAGELVGRFKRERTAYPALALTADTAVLTALGNDYGYENVFARQVEGLGNPGDILLLFSTSGNSENLVRAAAAGHEKGMTVVAVTGAKPNRLQDVADYTFQAPCPDTATIQEIHMLFTHLICDIAEAELCGQGSV